MKAEQFLNDNLEICRNRKDEFQLHDMFKFGKYAIQIARDEERKKALSAFEDAIYEVETKAKEDINLDLEELKKCFKDFLNR